MMRFLVVSSLFAALGLAAGAPPAGAAQSPERSTPVAPVASAAPAVTVTMAPSVRQKGVPRPTAAALDKSRQLRAQAATPSARAAQLVAQLPAVSTAGYGLVGVTWDPGFDETDMVVQVRSRTDGTWSSWQSLDVEPSEGEGGQDGTEPLWVGSADGVAVRVSTPTGRTPSDLKVATVTGGTTTPVTSGASTSSSGSVTDASLTTATATPAADGSPEYTPKPTIITRAQWGAKANTYCDSPQHGNETRGVVVHHTAGSNSYTKAQSASIVRAVQAYHMKGRGWCDIGYNYLVDKYGQIFQGRNGGLDVPVRAAHAGDKTVNTYTMGVSMMGTFDTSEPSAALKDSMVKLIGWRLGTTYHPATGTYKVGSYTLNRIAGHRDVVGTDCPGVKGYAWLSESGGLRDRVKAYIASYWSPIKHLRNTLGASVTGPVFIGEYPTSGGRKTRLLNDDIYDKTGVGTFWVNGWIRTEYTAVTSQAGSLGFPAAEPVTAGVTNVSLQRFEHGAIYRVVAAKRGYAIWGALYNTYKAHGEAAGELGVPTSRETTTSTGKKVTFQHGTITLATGSTTPVVTLK